ncbi:hypothetical protein BCR36DRAFT_332133 [Piromyces finnis]|uniref:Uncharacterized protein n=1 Tax=Piromyces finnis TaxID=1754191 RepID=A0A1Y1V524_9FUNG|nr:hypothetical protein BCR36DRAFT_332133 [Piromyces finnis]|eukprot:ORX46186.1 hypothetical protein BCR36DRAFT_332133 [Piromyces finnis]
MVIYKTVVNTLSEIINKSEYFNPFFSWIIVSFAYFSIGIHGGRIWKHLFYCALTGFMAICCAIVYNLSENLNYKCDLFIKLIWIEGYLWSINEWFYVYINYIKIQMYIKSLRKKFIRILVFLILVYSFAVRTKLNSIEYNMKKERKEDENIYIKSKNKHIAVLYFPPGFVCALFIYFIIKEFFQENNYVKGIISSLLHNTLSRMLLVSLLFINIAVIGILPQVGVVKFLYYVLIRLKGNISLIFLIDILLLRIDLDHNKIAMQDQEIEKKNVGRTLQEQFNNNNNNINYNFEDQVNIDRVNKLLSDIDNPFHVANFNAGNYNSGKYNIGINKAENDAIESHFMKDPDEFSVPPENLFFPEFSNKKNKLKKGVVPTSIYLQQHLNPKYYKINDQENISTNSQKTINTLPFLIPKSMDMDEDFEISNNSNGHRRLKDSQKNGKLPSNLPYMIPQPLTDDSDDDNYNNPTFENSSIYNSHHLSSVISASNINLRNSINNGNKPYSVSNINTNPKTSPSSFSYNFINSNSNKPYITTMPKKTSQTFSTKGNASKHPGNIAMDFEE